MTSSRDAILERLRRVGRDAARSAGRPRLPEPVVAEERREAPEARFAEGLEAAGGRAFRVPGADAIDEVLMGLPPFVAARRRCSAVPGCGRPTFVLDDVEEVHDLHDVGFALLRAEFAVAEGGAVWLTDAMLRHRAILHLAEHVGLVVPASELVDDLHDAYARIEFAGRGFGCFVSGPSKTADIEQSLVVGAHGPRSLTVLLVE